MTRMDQILLNNPRYEHTHPSIKTGFASIDSRTAFLRKGTLSLLGARPGMGKTTVALQIAANVTSNGGTVLFFSQRNSALQIADRANELKKDLVTCERLFIEDRVGSVDEMHLAIQDVRIPIDLVIVDDLQDVYCTTKKRKHLCDPSRVCGTLKSIATHFKTSVLVISQVSREVENRIYHVPNPYDIKGWDQIKPFVDSCCLLKRDGYYEPEDEYANLSATLDFRPSTNNCCTVLMGWDHHNNCLREYALA